MIRMSNISEKLCFVCSVLRSRFISVTRKMVLVFETGSMRLNSIASYRSSVPWLKSRVGGHDSFCDSTSSVGVMIHTLSRRTEVTTLIRIALWSGSAEFSSLNWGQAFIDMYLASVHVFRSRHISFEMQVSALINKSTDKKTVFTFRCRNVNTVFICLTFTYKTLFKQDW